MLPFQRMTHHFLSDNGCLDDLVEIVTSLDTHLMWSG